MKPLERSIKYALDTTLGTIIDADEEFKNTKDAYAVRHQFNSNTREFYCIECEQKLTLSTSAKGNLHFKHQPNAQNCILKDCNLTQQEVDILNQALIARESPRHKELKHKIGLKLADVEGIDISSIAIDDRYIIRDGEKRRPDVYCKYYDKELVFEIQLSDLSLHYILSRHNFYKKHGMYLVWILEKFDVHNQGLLEKDIKYLSTYQNFFSLDEEVDTFKLKCTYKSSYFNENEIYSNWKTKSIQLKQLNFDSNSFQVYYHNFGQERTKNEVKQQQIFKENKLLDAQIKADEIIANVKKARDMRPLMFPSIRASIHALDRYSLEILNKKLNFLNLSHNGKPVLNHYLSTLTRSDHYFIDFLLSCEKIDLDVNKPNPNGNTVLQEVYLNKELPREMIIKLLLKRGYKLTEKDIISMNFQAKYNFDIKKELSIFLICNRLADKTLVDSVINHQGLIFIIESARKKEIVGFNYPPNHWLAFAINAIDNYSNFWDYIKQAFVFHGLWEEIIKLDKNGTFQRKLKEQSLKQQLQSSSFDEVYLELYPELL